MKAAAHHCHATGCAKAVPPELLMCARHWRMVPRNLQTPVWSNYRVGQCDDKRPSARWLEAAKAAIAFVAETEASQADANPMPKVAHQMELI